MPIIQDIKSHIKPGLDHMITHAPWSWSGFLIQYDELRNSIAQNGKREAHRIRIRYHYDEVITARDDLPVYGVQPVN